MHDPGSIRESILVFLSALFFSILFTYPLAFQMGTHACELGDTRLNAYLQAWVTHALLHKPANLFDPNMFYPANNTLAGSESMLGNQPFFGPIYALTGNPILGLNFVILASIALCGVTMYLLVRSWTRNPWAAAIAGFIYAFAPARLIQLGHMQLLSMQWIPLIVLFLQRFLFYKKVRDLIALSAFMLLQILCSFYIGYFAILVGVAFFLGIVLAHPRLLTVRGTAGLVFGALCLAVLLRPLLHHYRQFLRSPGDLDFVVAASANPVGSYLVGAGRIYGDRFDRYRSKDMEGEKRLFPGFLPLGLAGLGTAFGLLLAIRARSRLVSGSERTVLDLLQELPAGTIVGSILAAAFSYILSLGPYLRIHDRPSRARLPFLWVRRWIPGLGMFRVPARFGLVFLFGLAILAAIGLLVLLQLLERWRPFRRNRWKAALTAAALTAIALEYNRAPLPLLPVMVPSNVAPEYRWLARREASTVILELPITMIAPRVQDPFGEAAYIYASTFHWHPLVNGYTGYGPPTASEMYDLAVEMPSPQAARILGHLGVRYVFLHHDRLSVSQGSRWNAQALEAGQMKTVEQFGETTIYELFPSECLTGSASVNKEFQFPDIAEAGKPFPFAIFTTSDGHCWVSRDQGGEGELINAEWQKDGSGKVTGATGRAWWPLYVQPDAIRQTGGFVRAPGRAGSYSFRLLKIGSNQVNLPPREVYLVSRDPKLPNSGDFPSGLSAHYDLRSYSHTLRAGDKAKIELTAKNTGRSVWLAQGSRGPVALGYHWYDAHGPEIKVEGARVFVPYSIYPGVSYTFRAELDAPSTPGEYALSLELVSELVAPFHDEGVAPIKVPVKVLP